MAQVLLISNDEVLNAIYTLNLRVYLACEVTVQRSVENALALLELHQGFDVVICQKEQNGQSIFSPILRKLTTSMPNSKLFLVGKSDTDKAGGILNWMEDPLNVQYIIKTIGKALGITAREMMEIPVPDYFPISANNLRNLETAPCYFYCEVDGKYEIVINKGDSVEPVAENLFRDGVHTLFIPKDFRLEITNRITSTVLNRLVSASENVEDKMDASERAMDYMAETLLNHPDAKTEVIEISKACIQTIDEVTRSIPKLKVLLDHLSKNRSGMLYKHSILTTYIAGEIIENISWGTKEHREKVQMVLFFHDLYLAPIYLKFPDMLSEDDLLYSDKLTEKEKELVINHARLGCEFLKVLPRSPIGADTILLQHHGLHNGVGFTLDYKDDISPLAKVIIIAESFVEEFLKIKEEGINPSASDIIDELRDKFRRPSYHKIIDALVGVDV